MPAAIAAWVERSRFMLTVPEKVAFLVAIAITGWLAYRAILRLVRIIGRGRGRPDWRAVPPG